LQQVKTYHPGGRRNPRSQLSNPKISTSHDRLPALPKDILIGIVLSEGVTTAFAKNSDRLIIFSDAADARKKITVPLDADRQTFCALSVERIVTYFEIDRSRFTVAGDIESGP
jgi:hypothetical protein